MAFEQAEMCDDMQQRRRLLNFVVVGAGPTGVELAGTIAELARRTLAADFRRIDSRSARVVLIEAGPRVLPALSDSLSVYAKKALRKLGVEVQFRREEIQNRRQPRQGSHKRLGTCRSHATTPPN